MHIHIPIYSLPVYSYFESGQSSLNLGPNPSFEKFSLVVSATYSSQNTPLSLSAGNNLLRISSNSPGATAYERLNPSIPVSSTHLQ